MRNCFIFYFYQGCRGAVSGLYASSALFSWNPSLTEAAGACVLAANRAKAGTARNCFQRRDPVSPTTTLLGLFSTQAPGRFMSCLKHSCLLTADHWQFRGENWVVSSQGALCSRPTGSGHPLRSIPLCLPHSCPRGTCHRPPPRSLQNSPKFSKCATDWESKKTTTKPVQGLTFVK